MLNSVEIGRISACKTTVFWQKLCFSQKPQIDGMWGDQGEDGIVDYKGKATVEPAVNLINSSSINYLLNRINKMFYIYHWSNVAIWLASLLK